jgi:hypothetical protein
MCTKKKGTEKKRKVNGRIRWEGREASEGRENGGKGCKLHNLMFN